MEMVSKGLAGKLRRRTLQLNGNARVGNKKRYIAYTYLSMVHLS
jgi:hypothetical protein